MSVLYEKVFFLGRFDPEGRAGDLMGLLSGFFFAALFLSCGFAVGIVLTGRMRTGASEAVAQPVSISTDAARAIQIKPDRGC